ncbi:MAG: ATP-binding protein [Solirubrobacterales bacterium]
MDTTTSTAVPAIRARTRADARAIQVAAKLASGAAEALELAPGPARRLSTILVEGTRNAVEHAYADMPVGDVEIGVELHRGIPGGGEPVEVVATVRDFGNGCPLGPTPGDPPGLGLSIISQLSEGIAIRSEKNSGTELDATIRADAAEAGPDRHPDHDHAAASHGSKIEITDPAFLSPVIPRAIGIHAAGAGASMDAVRDAIESGRRIAEAIDPGPVSEDGAALAIDQPDGSGELEVRMGPMPPRAAERLSARLLSRLEHHERVSVEPAANGGGGDRVLVGLPMRSPG